MGTVVQSYMRKNPCYIKGEKLTVRGLMLHSVGCPQPSAQTFINKWNTASYTRACVHAFIDANTGVVYQTLPWTCRGWHAGASGNNTHIGVEMCEPSAIVYTKGSKFNITNLAKAQTAAIKTYQSAVVLFADLCKQFNLDPLGKNVIISHSEGYKIGKASNHADPEHLWKGLSLPYTMDGFRKDVAAAMQGSTTSTVTPSTSQEAVITNTTTSTKTIKIGGSVKVKEGAKTYTGGKLASFVYKRNHIVTGLSGKRAVISYNGTVVAAIHTDNLIAL